MYLSLIIVVCNRHANNLGQYPFAASRTGDAGLLFEISIFYQSLGLMMLSILKYGDYFDFFFWRIQKNINIKDISWKSPGNVPVW